MQITTITVLDSERESNELSWTGTITRLILARLKRIFCTIMCSSLETREVLKSNTDSRKREYFGRARAIQGYTRDIF